MEYRRQRQMCIRDRRMAAEDADVVEHGSLDDKLAFDVQFGMGITNAHSTLHNERAVRNEYIPEVVVLRIVFVYYLIMHLPRGAEYKLSRRPCEPWRPAWR